MQPGCEDRLDPLSNGLGIISSTSKSSSSPFPPVVPVQHASWSDRNARKRVGSPFIGSGTGSSSIKLPSFSSTQDTTPSSMSHLPTCHSPLSPLTLSESSNPSPGDKETKFTPKEILQDPAKPKQQPIPPSADASGPCLSSDSDELGPQARASIRAWARAICPGPPRDTLSPVDSSVLVQFRSADARSASSLAHSQSSENSDPDPAADLRSGPGDGHDDDDGEQSISSSNALGNHSSSNNADVKNDGSASHPSASPPPSPSTRPARDRPLPFPPHAHSSASDSPPPAVFPSYAHAHDQTERLDRRQQRHLQSHSHSHSHSARRRHRDRDHRERDRRSRTSPGQAPEPRLPAPLTHPLRPLQLIAGGPDVLEEISWMLVHSHSRGPLVRPTRAETPPRRENDVLDDICLMVHLSRM